jgi:hypothetical protein
MDVTGAGDHDWMPVGKPEPGEQQVGVCRVCGGIGFLPGDALPELAEAGVRSA